MKLRHLTTINDVSNDEINMIFDVADAMSQQLKEKASLNIGTGYNMAALFFEPSTRTRLSFESAMYRLGGNVMSVVDTGSISIAKGETIADTARIIGSYVDIIVVRHKWEGTPRVIADYAGVPVINAGDGAHQHPTQTLTDLYTLRKEKGRIGKLTVALCGDLKYGRTVHSLAYALARFKANIVLISAHTLDMPDYILTRLASEYGCQIEICSDVGQAMKKIDAITKTSHTSTVCALPGLWGEFFQSSESISAIDAFYLTRVQKERFANSGITVKYPIFDSKLLNKIQQNAIIMHPLPRVDELAYKIDDEPRSAYFRQAGSGVPVRMALISFLLSTGSFAGIESARQKPEFLDIRSPYLGRYTNRLGVKCKNPNCISTQETESKQIVPTFDIITLDAECVLRCIYCEREVTPRYVGDMKSLMYFKCDNSIQLNEGTVFFETVKEAENSGFSVYKV